MLSKAYNTERWKVEKGVTVLNDDIMYAGHRMDECVLVWSV